MTIGLNFHIAHGNFLWQDISNDDIKIAVLVILVIVGISHYLGCLCFSNTSCSIHDLTTYWKLFGNSQPILWATFSSSNTKKTKNGKLLGHPWPMSWPTSFETFRVMKIYKNPRLLLRTESAKITTKTFWGQRYRWLLCLMV